jgi:AraC-like DNA-binding protein
MDRIAPALAHIAGHYSTPLYIEPLAKLCHTSPAQFRRMMKAATGYSPQEYITHLRLQMASAQLLGSDKRILDIALESGFATLSSFNRDFKRQLGCSPRAWRSEGGYSSPVASPI